MDKINLSKELRAPVAKVWSALTDFHQFGTWFKVKLESPFIPDQATQGHITHPGYEHLMMRVVVQRMEKERLFSFTWHPYAINPEKDYSTEQPTLVEFTLEPTATGTMLHVTESGFDDLPLARRDEAFEKNSQGWKEQLNNIEAYLKQ